MSQQPCMWVPILAALPCFCSMGVLLLLFLSTCPYFIMGVKHSISQHLYALYVPKAHFINNNDSKGVVQVILFPMQSL